MRNLIAFMIAMAVLCIASVAVATTGAEEITTVIYPFLPPWAQLAVTIGGAVYTAFVTMIRPTIPNETWARLGGVGRFIDVVVAGNWGNTKNKD